MDVQSNEYEEEGTYPTEKYTLDELDKKAIQLLDATDAYLKLYHSLSNTMRQGWLEIASARYSMGSSRISEVLFSLKPHSAHTSISLEYTDGVGAADENIVVEEAEGNISTPNEKYPTCFILHKWENKKEVEGQVDAEFEEKRSASQLRHRPLSHSSDKYKGEATTDNVGLESSSSSKVSQDALTWWFLGTLTSLCQISTMWRVCLRFKSASSKLSPYLVH